MERTRNVDFLTFDLKCDLDLLDRDTTSALCTSPYKGANYLCQFIFKTFQRFQSYEADTK